MSSTALNLLPWRKNKTAHLLKKEGVKTIVIMGMVALLLETLLLLLDQKNRHLRQTQETLQTEITQKVQPYQVVLRLQTQLKVLKDQKIQALEAQKNWHSFWANLQTLATLTPKQVVWAQLTWQENTFELQVRGDQLDALNHYQDLLRKQGFTLTLTHFEPHVDDHTVIATLTAQPPL